MVGFEQYPDKLFVVGTQQIIECRFVPYRDTRTFKRMDGAEVIPSFKIAFPFEAKPLLIGTIVTAQDKSGTYIVYEQEILGYHQGQLHNVGVV